MLQWIYTVLQQKFDSDTCKLLGVIKVMQPQTQVGSVGQAKLASNILAMLFNRPSGHKHDLGDLGWIHPSTEIATDDQLGTGQVGIGPQQPAH